MRLSKPHLQVVIVLLLVGCSKTQSTAVEPNIESPQAEASASAPTSQPTEPTPDTPTTFAGFVPDTARQEELRGIIGAALDSGDIDLAIAAGITMMETPENSGMRASAMALLAELYYQEREPDRAVDILSRLVVESPPVGEFHFVLGRILGELSRFEEAETHLREAIEIRPQLLQAYIYLGSVLYATGQDAAAEPVYLSYEQALTDMLTIAADREQPLSLRLEILEMLSVAMPDDRLTAAMVGLLSPDDFTVSVAAVRVLGEAGTPVGIPAMEAFADSAEREQVSTFVRNAISAIRGREGEF